MKIQCVPHLTRPDTRPHLGVADGGAVVGVEGHRQLVLVPQGVGGALGVEDRGLRHAPVVGGHLRGARSLRAPGPQSSLAA